MLKMKKMMMGMSQESLEPNQSPGPRRAKVVVMAKKRRRRPELLENLSGDLCHVADSHTHIHMHRSNKDEKVDDEQIHIKLGPHVTTTLVSVCACVL